MRHLIAVSAFTVAHFILSLASLFIGGGIIMAAFDGKGSDAAASVAGAVMGVLNFPVVSGFSRLLRVQGLGTVGEYALFAVNSMVWGTAAAILWAWWRRRRRAAAGA